MDHEGRICLFHYKLDKCRSLYRNTNNLERRNVEHQLKIIPGFTQKYNVRKLVYYEYFTDIAFAIEREKQLKKWRREKKNVLVDAVNPHWDNLFDENVIKSIGVL